MAPETPSPWSRAAAALQRSPRLQLLAFAAGLVAVQLLAGAAGKEFLLTQLTMAGYYTLVALGLSLLMGHAGQISIGHAGFFAIGGYASAFLTTLDLSASRGRPLVASLSRLHCLVARRDLYGGEALGVEPWVAFLMAVLLTALVAVAIGVPVLRLKGHYLAMATLAFGTIVGSVVLGTQRLGAADGISGVPPFQVLPGLRVGGGAAGLLAAWLRWGPGCLDRMNGQFAFALFDPRDGALWLARDRVGILPLHYARAGDRIAFASEAKALVAGGMRRVDGKATALEILRRTPLQDQGAVLAEIERDDAQLAAELRGRLFTFGDLVNLADRDLQTLLREIDAQRLTVALKGATADVRQKFLSNLSSRAAEMLSDDLQAMGPVKLSSVETAQQEIAKLAQELAQQGRITIVGPSEKML